MSSRQRKRPGGAVDSRPARKRSRLLPSSAAGTSQTEPIDLEQGAAPAFEPAGEEVIDLTGESSEPEVIIISDDESAVDREQSQQQSHLFRGSEDSAEPLARDDEEEAREDDGAWPADPGSPLMRECDTPEVQDKGQSQQYPVDSSEEENSAELGSSDSEEEPRDNDEAWTDTPVSPPICEDDNAEEQSQQYSLGSRAAENAAEVLANENEEELEDIELRPDASLLCVICMNCYSHLHQVYNQRRRNATQRRHTQVDVSGNGSRANDAPVAGSASAEEGAAEVGTAHSDAQPGVIRCPICMDCYSEIVESGRMILATMCGHVFCSECLPVALETVPLCPTCREELTPDLYIPLYI